jgi:dihydrofolate reductase
LELRADFELNFIAMAGKMILYSAISADGYIAKKDGSVSWLEQIPNPDKEDFGYAAFYDSVEITIMGHNTYRQIETFDGPFPYPDTKNYVITHRESMEENDNVSFISNEIPEFVKSLKRNSKKDIWLVGGSQTNLLMLQNDLIDEVILFMMPIFIGDGIPLFGSEYEVPLQLKQHEIYSNGVVEVRFDLKT